VDRRGGGGGLVGLVQWLVVQRTSVSEIGIGFVNGNGFWGPGIGGTGNGSVYWVATYSAGGCCSTEECCAPGGLRTHHDSARSRPTWRPPCRAFGPFDGTGRAAPRIRASPGSGISCVSSTFGGAVSAVLLFLFIFQFLDWYMVILFVVVVVCQTKHSWQKNGSKMWNKNLLILISFVKHLVSPNCNLGVYKI